MNHQRWIDVILLTLFQRCFVNVETTSISIRRLNFHFQPNINVETTFGSRRWIDVILSTVFPQRWNNVEKCTSAQLSFSTKYQRWNNVDKRWQSTLFQRWFNVDVFAGYNRAGHMTQMFFYTKYKINFTFSWVFRSKNSNFSPIFFSFKTNICFIKNYFWQFDKELSSFNQ